MRNKHFLVLRLSLKNCYKMRMIGKLECLYLPDNEHEEDDKKGKKNNTAKDQSHQGHLCIFSKLNHLLKLIEEQLARLFS